MRYEGILTERGAIMTRKHNTKEGERVTFAISGSGLSAQDIQNEEGGRVGGNLSFVKNGNVYYVGGNE